MQHIVGQILARHRVVLSEITSSKEEAVCCVNNHVTSVQNVLILMWYTAYCILQNETKQIFKVVDRSKIIKQN